jgi:hypothetical protein
MRFLADPSSFVFIFQGRRFHRAWPHSRGISLMLTPLDQMGVQTLRLLVFLKVTARTTENKEGQSKRKQRER